MSVTVTKKIENDGKNSEFVFSTTQNHLIYCIWDIKRSYLHIYFAWLFYTDYQGLTKSFCHGMIYCSSITAKLVNLKIGIPWDKIQVLPLNQKISIAGVDVTCFDANHCPGAIIILFEPPNGKVCIKHAKHTFIFPFSSVGVSKIDSPVHILSLYYTLEISDFVRK